MTSPRILISVLGLIVIFGGTLSAQSPNPRLMRNLLQSNREMVRLKAVAAIESMPRLKYEQLDSIIDGLATQVQRLDSDGTPPPSTAALMYAIASTNRDEAKTFLLSLLESENHELLMLAVDALGTVNVLDSVEPIIQLRRHPAYEQHYALRFGVVRTLWSVRSDTALDALAQIYRSTDGQLRADLKRMFEEVDAEDFDGDATRFSQWRRRWDPSPVATVAFEADAAIKPEEGNVQAGGAALRIPNVTDGGSAAAEIQFAAPQYYGIPIEAKRLMFVLDHSGSMRESTGGGVTRLDRAKEELIYAIQSLPPDHEFAILIYSNQCRLWRSTLSLATPKDKAEAIGFVRRIGYGDRTNTHAALSSTLGFDPSLEAVYLLSDGRPTLGAIVNPTGIVADICHRNRFRHLRFHTIGVSVEGPTKTFLETLAAKSNAEFREVN